MGAKAKKGPAPILMQCSTSTLHIAKTTDKHLWTAVGAIDMFHIDMAGSNKRYDRVEYLD